MGTEQGNFALNGVPLADSGYDVIWIPKGSKAPGDKAWQKIDTGPEIARRWAANGKADANVGVRCAHTPAVDIDIYDKDFARHMLAWTLEHLGDAPTRVGTAPKVLLVYSTNTPFKKRQVLFTDPKGTKHKIEVLADGQQFVAYGIHPDTHKPYKWTSDRDLKSFEQYELTQITQEGIDALFEEAIRYAREIGWTSGNTPTRASGSGATGEDLLDMQMTGDFTPEELSEALQYVDPDAGYDRWLQVGQALHFQFEGGDDGLVLWDKWSERSINYDADEIEKKWETFSTTRPRGVTAKSIIHWGKEGREASEKQRFEDIVARINACESVSELTGKLAKQLGKEVDTPAMLDMVSEKIRARLVKLGEKVRIDTIRKTMKQATQKSGKDKKLPAWCRHFVYVAQDDRFYDTYNHVWASERTFNARFNRLLGRDDADDSNSATRFALDILCLPVVTGSIYRPFAETIVEEDGIEYVNTYSDAGVPTIPSLMDEDEEAAIEIVHDHFKMLFPDERERNLLISFFANIVQNPERRCRWAPLIYGGYGAGKTTCFEMMRMVLGSTNVMPVNAKQLNQQFTGWAEGHQLVVFEEVRLTGHNRYDVVEALKPIIANTTVDIRRMHTDTYATKNITAYLAFTNHQDALPIQDGDRRYLVMTASLVHKKQIKAFKAKHPGYFNKLYKAIDDYSGAIRGWLMNWELHEEFDPNGDAPETASKDLMRESSHDEEYDDLEHLIEQAPQWDICEDLLCLKSLQAYASGGDHDIGDESHSIQLPIANRMKPVLRQLGFTEIGRARPGTAGRDGMGTTMQRYWSKTFVPSTKYTVQDYVRDRMLDEDGFVDELGLGDD